MQRIADEAEVARPTVYRRYPTREALVEAIGREAVDEFAAALDAARDQDEGAAATLTRLIRALARIGADYPIVLAGGTHAHDTAAVVERVDALIVRGQASGELRADVTSEVLRHALFGALAAGLRLARADGTDGDAVAARPDPDAIGAQVAAIMVEGMRADR
jgi:AcrR family transcriptional regulator